MADIRCPKCGKFNPEEAELCFFCGERLSGEETPSSAASQAEDNEDWLAGLRENDWQASPAAGPEEPEASDETGEEIPDWLARVRANSQADHERDEAEFNRRMDQTEAANDEPDWLRGLNEAAQAGQESPANDWLSTLQSPRSEPEPPPETEKPEDTARAESSAEASDWLENLRARQADEQASQPEDQPSAGQAETPAEESDWMADLTGWNSSTPGEEETPPAVEEPSPENFQPEEAAPDWLAQLTGGQPAPDTAAPTESPEPGEATSEAGDESAPGAAGETPDELPRSFHTRDLPSWLIRQPAGESTPSEPGDSEELPEWLRNAPPESPASKTPPASNEQLPDWLRAAVFNEAEPPAGETPESEPSSTEETVAPEPPAPAAPEESPYPDLSQFFRLDDDQPVQPTLDSAEADFNALFGAEPLTEEAEPNAQPEETLPNWLEPAPAEPASEEAAPGKTEAAPAEELPDWMKDFAQAAEPTPEEEPPSAENPAPFIDETLPSWLEGVQGNATDVTPPLIEAKEQPLPPEAAVPFQVDLPEWMDEAGPAAEGDAEPAEEPEETLEKAELPSWVEDLRPLESIIPEGARPDVSEGRVEKAGPLAGIRGVLPGEDSATGYRKPPVYSARLNVSDRQHTQASVLQDLLGLETNPKEVPPPPSRTPQTLLRVVIALLLVLPLLSMLLPDFHLASLPAQAPAALNAAYQTVENLPPGAPVLLAAEYEPSLSGEMRFAANSLVEHLMVRHARLTVLSTTVTGSTLANQLLTEVRNRQPEYTLSEQTINLGYLPGGTTSLLEFAQNPRQAAPYAVDSTVTGRLAWDSPALSGVNHLQDFALVVVLTDSPETGRAWMEQVQPSLGSIPLVMVTSAQAGPMLQPYYDSQQIRGMVVGLQGGAQYEQLSGRANQANRFLGAYQAGSLAGLLLLAVGGILSGVTALTDRRSSQKGKA